MKIIVKYICDCDYCQKEIEDMPPKAIRSYKDIIVPYEEEKQFCKSCRQIYKLSKEVDPNYLQFLDY